MKKIKIHNKFVLAVEFNQHPQHAPLRLRPVGLAHRGAGALLDTNSGAPQKPLSSGTVHEERIRGKRETRRPRQSSSLQQLRATASGDPVESVRVETIS